MKKWRCFSVFILAVVCVNFSGFALVQEEGLPSEPGSQEADTGEPGQSVGGQLQWSNIYAHYSHKTEKITSLESTFRLSKGAPNTQWVMGWSFKGPPPKEGGAGGYFGVNSDDEGHFQILGSIFNVAKSATVGAPHVTAVKFGGEGEGWSLRVTQENISKFPIKLDTTYKLRLNRKSVTGQEVTWEFIITDTDHSKSLNLGTIKTPTAYSYIDKDGEYQFSEYYGPGAPKVTCATVPLSVTTWSFPVANGTESAAYSAWSPPPKHCGEYKIDPKMAEGKVTLSFGHAGKGSTTVAPAGPKDQESDEQVLTE